MNKRVIFVMAWMAIAAPAQAQWAPQSSQAAHTLMMATVMRQTASATVAVAVDGTIVYAEGLGQIAPAVPPTPATIYHIGSVSKQFTAAGILALAEDRATVRFDQTVFNIDDNVSLFFTNVDRWSMGPSAQPMTVRRLLNMMSRLPTYTDPHLLPQNSSPSKDVLLRGIKQFMPRDTSLTFEYSNTNYFLLANIIEILTASDTQLGDYRQYLSTRIFQRTGMTATGFVSGPPAPFPVAPLMYPGHAFDLGAWPMGAGEIQSNVLDLTQWDTSLFGGSVISPQSLQTMLAPVALMPIEPQLPQQFYAMGWMVRQFSGGTEYAHGGNIFGYTAENIVVRTATGHLISVVILTNADSVQHLYETGRQLAQMAMSSVPQ